MRLARVSPFPPPSPVPRPRPVAFSVSWAPWLLFSVVLAPCLVLRVQRPGPPGSCSPLCTPCVWCCVHGFLGLLALAHRRARSVCGVAGAVSWAAWSLFTGVHVRCVFLRARCPGPLCSCSPVCLPRCAVSCVRCPGPLGSCSPVCKLCVRCCMSGVLGLLAPVHRCACSLCAPRLLPFPLPLPRLYKCMLSVSALLLFPAAAFSSSWRPWLLHSSLRPCQSALSASPEWWSGGVVEWWSGGVVEWWSGGVVEWWSGGVVEWWSGGVVEWWSGGVVEWWSGGVVEWWCGGVVEWWCGGVVEWWSGGVVEWWSGGVVEWWSGGVVEWWSGGVVEWWSGGVVEWSSGGVVEWWSG